MTAKHIPNVKRADGRLLMRACERGESEVVAHLLGQGVNPNTRGASGMTALMMACQKGRVGATRLLLSHGSDPNLIGPGGFTALMFACYGDVVEIVQILIEHGADVTVKDMYFGHDALWHASRQRKWRVVELLNRAMGISPSTEYLMGKMEERSALLRSIEKTARATLSGQLDFLTGIRRLYSMCNVMIEPRDGWDVAPDLQAWIDDLDLGFTWAETQTDEYSIISQEKRGEMSPEELARADAALEDFVLPYRDYISQLCKEIVTKFPLLDLVIVGQSTLELRWQEYEP